MMTIAMENNASSADPPEVISLQRAIDWIMRSDRSALLFVGVFAAALILPFLGVREITTSGEAQRAYPPIEMLKTGDLMIPRLNGEVYLEKPPLMYWMTLPSYVIFGVNEFSARIVDALMGTALVLVVFNWCRQMGDRRISVLAAMICAANYLFIDNARECQVDMGLALFTTLTLQDWWKGMKALEENAPRSAKLNFYRGALWLAIAHMFKMPVPFLFVLSAFVGTACIIRKWKWLRWPHVWSACLLSTLPFVIWTAFLISKLGLEDTIHPWWDELRSHIGPHASSTQKGPVTFYLFSLFIYFIPWSFLFPVLLMRKFERSQRKDRMTFYFLWCSIAIPIIGLSINTAKETEYMLCAIAPLSILLARSIHYLRQNVQNRILQRLTGRRVLITSFAGYLLGMWFWNPVYESFYYVKRTPKALVRNALAMAAEEDRPVVYFCHDSPKLYFYVGEIKPYIPDLDGQLYYLREHPNAIIFGEPKRMKELAIHHGNLHFDEIGKAPSKLAFSAYKIDDSSEHDPPSEESSRRRPADKDI
ncbi:MAG: glycosyltransferase family 39 protein [Candidatus Sumerlaeota bacterium]